MKKVILILAVLTVVFTNCKKKEEVKPEEEAYCVYGSHNEFISCEKNQADLTKKMIQLRDDGVVGASSVKKSTCSDC